MSLIVMDSWITYQILYFLKADEKRYLASMLCYGIAHYPQTPDNGNDKVYVG